MSKQIDLEKLREMAEDDVKRGRQWSTDSRDVLMLLDHIAALEKDAARYRFLRDCEWRETALEPVIRLQLNALWDSKIDTAMEASNAKAD